MGLILYITIHAPLCSLLFCLVFFGGFCFFNLDNSSLERYLLKCPQECTGVK